MDNIPALDSSPRIDTMLLGFDIDIFCRSDGEITNSVKCSKKNKPIFFPCIARASL
ncbi:hypothetical protein [Azotobacter armeniacus]